MSTSPTDFDAAALWDLVPDALFAVEDTGEIAAANDAASEMFGVASDQGLVGLPIEVLVDEDVRASHAARRDEWTRSPTPRLMGENRVFPARTFDGRRIEVQVALNPVRIDDRRITIAVVRDVTDNSPRVSDQALARDEIVQRLFGLGMSLRSVVSSVQADETARRIEAVVDGMSEVVDALDGSNRESDDTSGPT